jgi:hypothetical protein
MLALSSVFHFHNDVFACQDLLYPVMLQTLLEKEYISPDYELGSLSR